MSAAYTQGQIVDNELTNQSVRIALSCYKISLVASAVSNCSKVLYFHVHLLIYCFPCPCIASSAVDAFSRLKTPFSVFSGLLWTGGKRNDISFAPWHVHPH